MRTPILLAAAAVTTAVTLLFVTPAEAARYQVDLDGIATFVSTDSGAASLTGAVTGIPFDGKFTSSLATEDGSLPAPGQCEPATVRVQVSGSHDRYLDLTATGEVCGTFVQPPDYLETERFTGRYAVSGSSQKRVVGTDGFIGLSLGTEGRAVLTLIDT